MTSLSQIFVGVLAAGCAKDKVAALWEKCLHAAQRFAVVEHHSSRLPSSKKLSAGNLRICGAGESLALK
jgi:hypothetical protein